MSESKSNAELARRGFQAWLRGDFEAVAAVLDPEVKWHGGDPSAAGACRNQAEALEFMRRARGRRGLGELVDVIAAGDRVVVIMRRADQPGGLAANLTTFRDGKVVEMVHYASPDDALGAAGIDHP